jgi:hypothetical protein
MQAEEIRVQKTLFDLDSFQEVTLVKMGSFSPVASTQEALARVSNDTAKFLELVNEGLRAEYQREIRGQANGWHSLDDEGEVNGEFSGTIADPKAVGALVLTLAKTVFGYSKDISADAKAQAKASAMAMIKGNDAIREGLKKSAALSAE